MRDLIRLRKENRALRVGDYRPVISERIYAFERHTDRVLETVIVLVNPARHPVTETLLVRNPDLMDAMPLADLLGGNETGSFAKMSTGTLQVTLPAQSIVVLKHVVPYLGGYNRYKRVR